MNIEERIAQYARVPLMVDPSPLTDSERNILPLLIEPTKLMDEAFWIQAYGDRASLLSSISDPGIQQYVLMNYGPWDALRDDEPFVTGVGTKPPGANFYPPDMTRGEFEVRAGVQPDLRNRYTMVQRDTHGSLIAIPYHQFFSSQMQTAAEKLQQAAERIDQSSLQTYLRSALRRIRQCIHSDWRELA